MGEDERREQDGQSVGAVEGEGEGGGAGGQEALADGSDGNADPPDQGEIQDADSTVEQAEGRAVRRAPHPIWRVVKALLILGLMAGATWGLYEGLVRVAGPSLASKTQAYKLDVYSAQSYDPQGVADLSYPTVRPLAETEGQGLLVTWAASNLGTKTWFPSTHHWEPLYPDLPPLPLPRPIQPGESAQMAVRLTITSQTVVGWRLVGLKGPVQNGEIQINISPTVERK